VNQVLGACLFLETRRTSNNFVFHVKFSRLVILSACTCVIQVSQRLFVPAAIASFLASDLLPRPVIKLFTCE
jgi:hypothetical protein